MGQVLLACMGSKSRGMLCNPLPMHPSPGLSMVTPLILVEQRLSQTITAGSRSHPKGSKLEQVGPCFWHCQPTCRSHRIKNPSKIAHTHLQTASSNHRLKYEGCSKPLWLWTSKGKGKCTGEKVILWFSASLQQAPTTQVEADQSNSSFWVSESMSKMLMQSLIFLFDLLCHLCFHYHLLNYIQDHLFENRNVVKI